jgi:hypothetical protein
MMVRSRISKDSRRPLEPVLVEMVTLAGPMISELSGSSGIARRAASTAAAGSPSRICRMLRPSHASASFGSNARARATAGAALRVLSE